jgi:hypothetical protein
MDLPTYKSTATPEERQKKLVFMREQIELLHEQERNGTPLMHIKIRCGCNKMVTWWMMIRCLYCGVFYCVECAEEHFGMRREKREYDNLITGEKK